MRCTRLPLALALVVASGAPAYAQQTQEIPVNGAILTLDTSDPDTACRQFHEYLHQSGAELDDGLYDSLRDQICQPQEARMVSVVVLGSPSPDESAEPAEGEPEPNPIVIDVSASAGFAHGNQNYGQVNGRFGLSKKIDKHNRMGLGLEGGYRYEEGSEDAEAVHNTRVVVTADYKHQFGDHWAFFSLASLKHDSAQNIDIATEELLGIMYNIFPHDAPSELKFSVGAGHRYENRSDDTDLNDAIIKWRVKYEQKIAERLQLLTTLWYRHSAYSYSAGGEHQVFDFTDYEIEFDLTLRVVNAIAEGVHITFTFEDNYRSRPAGDAENNDLRLLFGIEGKFGI